MSRRQRKLTSSAMWSAFSIRFSVQNGRPGADAGQTIMYSDQNKRV
jgi:hypothetical protein